MLPVFAESIVITIPMNPVPASRPRVTRWGTFYGKRYTTFRQEFSLWANQNLKGIPPLDGQICIERCVFKLQMPKSWSKKKKLGMDGKPHIIKPDKDNLEKAIIDGLSGILYNDDCQIWRSREMIKIWSMIGGIELELSSKDERNQKYV